MIENLYAKMHHVYSKLGRDEAERKAYLTSRKLVYINARHIVRYILYTRYEASYITIDRLESRLTGKKTHDMSRIKSSVERVEKYLIKTNPKLYGYINDLFTKDPNA